MQACAIPLWIPLMNVVAHGVRYEEGRAGVLLWCVISRCYFSWNVKLGNYSSWSLNWRFRVTRVGLELLIDVRDFTTPLFVILRRESSECLESSIRSDLGMQFALRSLDLTFHDFAVFKQSFQCKNRSFKRLSHLPLFSWFGKTKSLYPWSLPILPFSVRESWYFLIFKIARKIHAARITPYGTTQRCKCTRELLTQKT